MVRPSAGSGVRAQLRAERRIVRRRVKWRLILVSLGWLAVAVALNLWPAIPRWWGGFVVGVFIASIPLLLLQVDVTFGIATREMGHAAEQWTAAALRRLRLRGWRLLHDVRFAGLNVDHVAVGPDRIVVVETKWIGAQRDLNRARADAVQQADACARKIRNLLRSPPRLDRVVEPVAVLWGPGVPRDGLDQGGLEGVQLVSGSEVSGWVRGLSLERGRPDREAYKALRAYQRRSTVPPPSPSLGPPRS
jgi:hypothetical protein